MNARVHGSIVARTGAVALLVMACGLARAQGNDLSVPTGGRSTLMGNTGVALARDGSAPFLNPATIVRINDFSLAFSANFYTFAATHFSGWHQPGPVDASLFGDVSLHGTAVSSDRLHILPSTLCLFFTIRKLTSKGATDTGLHRGRQKLAICFGSTESEDFGLPALPLHASTPLGSTSQAQSVARDWNRLRVGPTYSLSLTDHLAIGASLQGVYTSESFVFDSSSVTSAQGGSAIESSLGASANGHAFDMTAVAGAMIHAGKLTLGASAELPAVHVFGLYEATLHEEYGNSTSHSAILATGTGDFHAPPPARFALGAGLEWGHAVVELDETLEVPVGSFASMMSVTETTLAGGATPVSSRATYVVPERPVWNTSAGVEYRFSPSFSVLGGASTNFSTLLGLSPTTSLGDLAQARTNNVAVSFGIGSYGGGTDLLIGTQLGFGWGQSVAVDPYVVPNQLVVADMQSYSAMIVFAGSTNLRSIGRALEKIQNAVTTGNPDRPNAPTPGGAPKLGAPSHSAESGRGPDSAPSADAPREPPKSGESDPRNREPDGGVPPSRAPPQRSPSDGGAPPAKPSDLPPSLLDPLNRDVPSR